jgi:hypothetical protein
VGLCLAVASFHEIRITFTKPAVADFPPIVQRGQEFGVEGIIDCGDNIYRQIDSVEIYLLAKDPRTPGGEVRRNSTRADFDHLSFRFTGRLLVKGDEDAAFLIVRVGAFDRFGRQYGPGLRPLAGNELKVRVE